MAENKLQKRSSSSIKEKGQYLLAVGVIASMLLVVGFPVFVVFFLGIFAYFLWRIFAAGTRNETREIFEFYLSANEILRDDERRWYGFEIKEVVARGERILQSMTSTAPPLVHFTLGALYNKIGEHSSAIKNLSHVYENEGADERSFVYPSNELRNYVRVLRKIEREPAEAPLTSGAVRSLERARKNRGRAMLDESRRSVSISEPAKVLNESSPDRAVPAIYPDEMSARAGRQHFETNSNSRLEAAKLDSATNGGRPAKDDPFVDRKSISEVLHDIYDENIQ